MASPRFPAQVNGCRLGLLGQLLVRRIINLFNLSKGQRYLRPNINPGARLPFRARIGFRFWPRALVFTTKLCLEASDSERVLLGGLACEAPKPNLTSLTDKGWECIQGPGANSICLVPGKWIKISQLGPQNKGTLFSVVKRPLPQSTKFRRWGFLDPRI